MCGDHFALGGLLVVRRAKVSLGCPGNLQCFAFVLCSCLVGFPRGQLADLLCCTFAAPLRGCLVGLPCGSLAYVLCSHSADLLCSHVVVLLHDRFV